MFCCLVGILVWYPVSSSYKPAASCWNDFSESFRIYLYILMFMYCNIFQHITKTYVIENYPISILHYVLQTKPFL